MINIKIMETFTKKERLSPKDIFSKPYGEVYVLKSSKSQEENKPSYLIACGINEGAMFIWWNDEDKSYQLAPADLEGYAKHMYVERVECDINIALSMGGKNET